MESEIEHDAKAEELHIWAFVAYYRVKLPLYICTYINAGLLATGQISEVPAIGHLDNRFFLVPLCPKANAERFPRFQVATTCFLLSHPDLNLVVTNCMFCLHLK